MTEDQAMRCVGWLAGAIPGFSEEAVEVFASAFEMLDDALTLDEVCQRMATTWVAVPGGAMRPSLGEIVAEYRDAVRSRSFQRDLHALPPPAHCDGTGWIRAEGMPCPRCNPYLAHVFTDPALWERWMDGARLMDLVPAAKGEMPTRCKIDRHYDDPVPLERARQLLAEGIEAGRAERLARAQQGDPAVLARLLWWRNGAVGHYPGCACKRCETPEEAW